MSYENFDVIVVGAGHAGIEACLAPARLGLKTLMITTNIDRIGYMSCNPSIGGLAKGHMVREIDTLGGQMAIAADETCIQYKRLNASKGPAVRGTRVQSDKVLYAQFQKNALLSQQNLKVIEAEVKRLVLDNGVCKGVVLNDGSKIFSKTVILTTGTFMNGVMHVGLKQEAGGRVGDLPSIGLSDQLAEFGFEVKRLKTGTPARLLKDSIDWSKTIPQAGDEKIYPFSSRSSNKLKLPQVLCYLSRTTEKTHDIIRANLDKSPMYCGLIEGIGPRYCPSIEDKVTRFAERTSHQTFLEPESLSTDLIYLQGISTSLPEDIQDEFLRTIPGLEQVKIARYGYAVEYDYIEPTQIWHRLETRTIDSLFLAGQINGTSGYEEAAAQGFIAGVNAAHKILGREEFILGRDQAYMGVMIDDLVTKGTREPYRMFTSRAEHRLVLREDNTVDRLGELGRGLGLVSDDTYSSWLSLKDKREALHGKLKNTIVYPTKDVQAILATIPTPAMTKSLTFEELLRRPELTSSHLELLNFELDPDPNVVEPVEIEVKYSGYVKRQMDLIHQSKRLEELLLPEDISYSNIRGLSNEEIDKLQKVRPRTLGQAQRISGVNPSAVQAIMIHLKGHKKIREMDLVGNKTPEKSNQFRLANWFPELTNDQISKLEMFYDDLILVNKSSSLLPHKTLGSIDSVYFADCIYGSRLIYEDNPQVKEILDLGTGIGLPGLIFAILFPQVKVLGLDADFRKCAFLKEVILKLGIENFEVIQATTEQFNRVDFEAVMTRDFNTISRTLLTSRKLVKSGGALYHFKGEEWSLEVSEMPSQLCSMWQPSLVGEYKLPSGGVKKEYILKTTRL